MMSCLGGWTKARWFALLLVFPVVLSLTGCGLWYNKISPDTGSGSGSGGSGGSGGGGGNGGGSGGSGSVTKPLTVSPTTLSWVKENVGQTSGAKTLTVTNPNTAAVTMGAIAAGNDYVIHGSTCPMSGSALAAAATCSISVDFRPMQLGQVNETLTIASNAPQSPLTVPLSGVGVKGPLYFDPPVLNFPTTATGQSSAPMTSTLTNTTNQDITMTAIVHSKVFQQSNNCTPTLPGGGSCTFQITFTPVCSGSDSGTTTARAGTDTVQLYEFGDATGTSTCPGPGTPGPNTGLSFSPGRLLFGDQTIGTVTTLKLQVTNFQSYSINIGNISIPAPFTQQNNCPATLPEGFSCQINVTFAPTAKGYYSELLSVTDSGEANPQTVTVTGNAVP